MPSFSDYNPGFADPNSIGMQQPYGGLTSVAGPFEDGSTVYQDEAGAFFATDAETGALQPAPYWPGKSGMGGGTAAAPPPPPPPLPTTTGFPRSAWSTALHDGMASGQGVRQIMADYNPGMFGRLVQPAPAAQDPAQALLAGMMPPTPPPPTGGGMPTVSGGGGGMPAPPPPPGAPAQPGMARIAGQFPGMARRMGYQPTPPIPTNPQRRGR